MPPHAAELIAYPCGRCGEALEAPVAGAPAWHRCPHCGRGGLPPFRSTVARQKLVEAWRDREPDVHVIGEDVMDEPAVPWFGSGRPADAGRDRPGRHPATTTGLTIAFALCVSLFVVTLFLGDNFTAGLFGVGAGVALLVLVRPSR